MYKALDIAKYIIERCNENKENISNLKLQKILYFVQAEFLVAKNQPCFDEKIEAWDFGPVIPEVYYAYRNYGGASIPCFDNSGSLRTISRSDRKLLDGIIDECAQYSASYLVELTHNQTPWQEAYKRGHNVEIDADSIKKYFEED